MRTRSKFAGCKQCKGIFVPKDNGSVSRSRRRRRTCSVQSEEKGARPHHFIPLVVARLYSDLSPSPSLWLHSPVFTLFILFIHFCSFHGQCSCHAHSSTLFTPFTCICIYARLLMTNDLPVSPPALRGDATCQYLSARRCRRQWPHRRIGKIVKLCARLANALIMEALTRVEYTQKSKCLQI